MQIKTSKTCPKGSVLTQVSNFLGKMKIFQNFSFDLTGKLFCRDNYIINVIQVLESNLDSQNRLLLKESYL